MFDSYYAFKVLFDKKEFYRRFSDFDKLHKYLTTTYKQSFFPHLPEKSAISKVKASADFLETRRKDLELYLKKILTHTKIYGNVVGKDPDEKVKEFLDDHHKEVSTFVLIFVTIKFKVEISEKGISAIASGIG
jgi:hypothetical protein